eukprot:CAMPEP_0179064434 /NCGR_PEP_ID=MMETSP0796-20121207/27947_1 /TAXON_ID=73915 /ORGANISM="Pyrodinium bahamense, Strain pbaha01" /LENGTH=141 /DNA_ID=CAMNT_0020761383 /DNA_START=392 /DNA_END=817 /DNA_ORIENTATION=-
MKGIIPITRKQDRKGAKISVEDGGPSQKVCSGASFASSFFSSCSSCLAFWRSNASARDSFCFCFLAGFTARSAVAACPRTCHPGACPEKARPQRYQQTMPVTVASTATASAPALRRRAMRIPVRGGSGARAGARGAGGRAG